MPVSREALKRSDNNLTEQMMIEDKLKATDWEATDVAVAEQVARDSYLQWLADQEKNRTAAGAGRHPPAATVTSGAVSPRAAAASSSSTSTNVSSAPSGLLSSPRTSPKAGCSYQSDSGRADSPKPGSSRSDHGLGPGFHLRETASFLNGLPPDAFGESFVSKFSPINYLLSRTGGLGRRRSAAPGSGCQSPGVSGLSEEQRRRWESFSFSLSSSVSNLSFRWDWRRNWTYSGDPGRSKHKLKQEKWNFLFIPMQKFKSDKKKCY